MSPPPNFFVVILSFIALYDGESVDSLAEGKYWLRSFLQIVFIGGAHLRESEGVFVIFLLDGGGDRFSYYVLHFVSSLYCGVRTTETILA